MKGEKEEEKKSPNKKNRYQCFIIDLYDYWDYKLKSVASAFWAFIGLA